MKIFSNSSYCVLLLGGRDCFVTARVRDLLVWLVVSCGGDDFRKGFKGKLKISLKPFGSQPSTSS